MESDQRSLIDVLSLFPEVWPTIFLIDAARYVLFAAPVVLTLWLLGDLIQHRRIQKRQPQGRDRRREILLSIGTSVVFSLNGFFFIVALKELGLMQIASGSGWVDILWQSILIVLAHDAWFYWLHRAMHWRRLFRMAHMAHHRSRTPSAWAAYAFVPLEALLEAIFLPLFMLAVTIDTTTILVFLMHMMARNVIGHCGYELFPSGWTRIPVLGWINTVTHHDIHHEVGRWNYGLYFAFWDRLMGTEHPDYHARFQRAACSRSSQRDCSSVWQG